MLDRSVREKLRSQLNLLAGDGSLMAPAALDGYYATFRDRFGPDRLAALDGEPLLETMHGRKTKGSLVYWLEYKNDDEFPTKRFGGIGGGTALKFGLFYRRASNQWVAKGEGNVEKELTVTEAIEIARRHRDQYIRGVELLSQLPDNGTDEDYEDLQKSLDRDAPQVSQSAWGHKYFALLFPSKLDDYHSPKWQRFHLLKMLQLPPGGDGRYDCAGRFVAAASELAVPMFHLTFALDKLNGPPHRYWRVGTNDGAGSSDRWDVMRNENCVAIGWPFLGDLSDIGKPKESREKLQKLLLQHSASLPPDADGKFLRRQIFNFLTGIGKGDWVVASRGDLVLGVGQVTGGYAYEQGSDLPHRRPVKWLLLNEWNLPQSEGKPTIAYEILRREDILEAERHVQGGSPPPPLPPSNGSIEALADSLLIDVSDLRLIDKLVKQKRQMIFYGPPGTGKTYVARELARHYAGKDGATQVIQFHPSYAYEDFVEGFRPRSTNGQAGFSLVDGPLKRIAKQARENPAAKHVLIIDEINRGNVAKVFGELYFLLEYRNEDVSLQYSDQPFALPENLWIIGTMNTADRSIALIDAALRRRFYFLPFFPDKPPVAGLLLRWLTKHKPDLKWVASVLDAANGLLGDNDAAIGPSHFMRHDLTEDWVPLIWRHSVLPYLEEQLLGEKNRLEEFDLSKLRASVQKTAAVQTDADNGTSHTN